MTRRYEVVYIFDASLDEAAVSGHLAKFHELLGGGVEVTVNHWGKRTLAYPIKKRETGYYVVAQFQAGPEVLPEFERAIKLDEAVFRFLVVMLEGELPTGMPTAAAVGAEEEEE